MIGQGWHYLPGNPRDEHPPLPACTVLDLDVGQARTSAQLVRPYFTGKPDPGWLAAKLSEPPCAGQRCQLGNETNLPQEGFPGGPADYAAWFLAVADRAPAGARLYWSPPSPGLPGWQAYYDDPACASAIGRAAGLSVHAYGTCAQMLEIVRYVVGRHPTKPAWVSEINPGAGNVFDLNAWAHAELRPFLDACAAIPQVEAVCFFAFQWDQSPHLPSSVDGHNTAVEEVLHGWVAPPTPQPQPPQPEEPPVPDEWYPQAARKPISRNYTPGRAGQAVYGIVDHIAEGNGGLQGWFNNPAAKASTHFWVSKGGAVEQYRPLGDTCWSNGVVCDPDTGNPTVARILSSHVDPNAVTVAIEHEGFTGQQFPAAQVEASAALHAWLGERFGIPLERSQVLGHYQLDSCNRAHCPGATFPWEEVLSMPAPPSPEVIALQDALFALADQLQRLQPQWAAQGQQQMALYCAEQGEAIKRAVALHKGER